MPYGRKRNYRRTVRTSRGRSSKVSRRSYGRKKYVKVSRKRIPWTPGTSVSPYRKFVYNDTGFTTTLTSIAATTWHLFRGNSLYDPDYTGVGVQPYGYDQICPAFYTEYCVRAAKISVYPSVKTITSASGCITCLLVPYHEGTLSNLSLSDLRRMPHARSMTFGSNNLANHDCSKVSAYASTKSVMGRNTANDHDACAVSNNNPTSQWYWYVFMDSSQWVPASDIDVRFDVKITYYTVLSRKYNMNES